MNKGIALVTALIIVLLLFVIVGTFLFLTTNARLINERYHENLIALELAEAGVDFAIWEMNFGGGDFLTADGWGGSVLNPTMSINNFQDADGNVYGDIDIAVYNPGTTSVTVISTGSLTSITGPTVRRRVRVVLKKHNIFQYAILTAETIDIGGTENKIDSYDSSLGSYGGSNVGSEGDIVTNGQGTPAITLRGGADIDGDADTGPGGTVEFQGGATLSGTVSDDAEVFMPSVDVPDDLENLTSEGELYINKKNDPDGTFTTGNYKYDSLTLTSKGQLIIDGDVNFYFTGNPSITTDAQSQIVVQSGSANIYFDGNMSLAGDGITNEGGNPADITFYGTDSVENISISGIGTCYGTFYAPEADYFYISGNSEIYGAVVGENVALAGTAAIHFDENLLSDEGPTIGYTPLVWQEKY